VNQAQTYERYCVASVPFIKVCMETNRFNSKSINWNLLSEIVMPLKANVHKLGQPVTEHEIVAL